MNKNNATITSISTNTKENTSMKNATIYYVVKKAVFNSINSESPNYISELKDAVKKHSIPANEEFWIEAQKYAKKVLAKTPSEKTSTLNIAYGFINDGKNEDLISECTIRLFKRYDYLVNKFIEHTINCSSEEETIKKFNGAVSLIIPSFLTELWRKVSDDQEYEDTDTTTNQKFKKTGKGLHKTLLTSSIDKNNSSDSDEELTLANTLVSKEISAEDRVLSRDSIIEYLTPIVDSPRELLGFMCVTLGISADKIIDMMSDGMSMVDIFAHVCLQFSNHYDVPIMHLSNRFTEKELSYTGVMDHKKQLSNERSSGKKKVKTFILQLNGNK